MNDSENLDGSYATGESRKSTIGNFSFKLDLNKTGMSSRRDQLQEE